MNHPLPVVPMRRCARATLAAVALTLAAGAGAATQSGMLIMADGVAYGIGPAPHAGCEIGRTVSPETQWVEANGAATARTTSDIWIGATYRRAVSAAALRANLNRGAMRQLSSVLVAGEDGKWRAVWSGTLPGPVASRCEQAWFVVPLIPAGGAINAVRFTFRTAAGAVHVANAGLLPAGL